MARLGFTLSPHKVALSVLIQDLCTPERVPVQARPVLSVFLLQQVRQSEDCSEKSLSQLCAALSSLSSSSSSLSFSSSLPSSLGQSLEQQLVATMRRIQSPDDLFDILINLESLLQDGSAVEDEMPGLDSSSVLGIFVRKVLLAFHSSMFDGLSTLYTRVEEYLAALDAPADAHHSTPQAPTELANFIQHHADVVETMPPSLQMSGDLDEALRAVGEPAGGSYIRFLYAVQQRDYQASIEHLHRYFDYAMVRRGLSAAGRERGVLQWALLQLASLHFRLGHMPLSLIALEESVRLAQHASDHHCLATALVWLMRLVGVAGERELEGQLLRRALLRSSQLGLTALHEQTLLSLAMHRTAHPPKRANALDGGSPHPTPAAAASQILWRALGAGAGAARQGTCLVLDVSIRGALGHAQLAGTGALGGGGGMKLSADLLARGVCLKASNEAQIEGPRGPAGRLVAARDAFPRHLLVLWHHASLLLLLQRALARRDLARAQVAVRQMGGMLVPNAEVRPLLEAEQSRAELLLRSGDAVHGISLLHRLKDVCAVRRVGVEAVPVTVSLAASLAAVGSWGAALGAALGGLAMAEDSGMDSSRVAAMLVLTGLELEAGRAGHGLALLLRVHPIALSSGSLSLRAQSHILLARCLLGGAPCPYPRGGALEAAGWHLDEAIAALEALESMEELRSACHLRALAANAVGDVQARDAAARKFWTASVEQPKAVGVLNQLCLAPQRDLDLLANEP